VFCISYDIPMLSSAHNWVCRRRTPSCACRWQRFGTCKEAFGCDTVNRIALHNQQEDEWQLQVLCAWQYHVWSADFKTSRYTATSVMRAAAA
jgi:hypothetical protein